MIHNGFRDKIISDKEIKWFEERSVISSNFYDFCRIVISRTKEIRNKARDTSVNDLKKVLTDFYKVNMPSVKELVVSFNARKLEESIYSVHEQSSLYDYI